MTNPFPRKIKLNHGTLPFPIFIPDGTFGVVRTMDSDDLQACGIQALMMNTFHLMQKPGVTVVQALGGLHKMSAWQAPIFTDSGGFQAYSLIHQNPKMGSLGERGITYLPEGTDRKFQLTPEKCVQLQFAFGSDVVIFLDDCTHVDASRSEQEESVRRTIAWGKRCKKEFDRLISQKGMNDETRPRAFGVIQGGGYMDLRQSCANALLELGVDGFGFGGWPLDSEKQLLEEILSRTREFVPSQFPLHALGIGHPVNLLASWKLGYGIFDCAMPTRDARHGRFYTFSAPYADPKTTLAGDWLQYKYIDNDRNIRADRPIEMACDCPTCRHYSIGYLHHLFKSGESLYYRLVSMHNLRFMTRLTARLR